MRRRSLAAGLAATLLALGCWGDTDAGAGVPTLHIEATQSFTRTIKAEGTLQAVQATPILPPSDTQRPMKVAWVAQDGTPVEKGDVVIRFDASELERELLDSRDDVRSSERLIDKVGVERTAGRENRDETANLADFEVRVAREFEQDDTEIFSRVEIAESEIDVDLAVAKARHARKVKGIEGRVSSNQMALHQIARDQAVRQVERAEEGLDKLEVKAPHGGVFVLERGWKGNTVKVGDTVWPGQKLAELPLVSDLEAKLFVLEADAGALAEGITAEVYVDARPSIGLRGTVKQVDALAQPRHPEVPVNYFGVTVKLDETDVETMRVGQRVSAKLQIEATNAIVVPRQSVFERDGRTLVYCRDGRGFEPRQVELGAASAGRVVVESGLETGDEIALRDPTKAADELLSDLPAGAPQGGAHKQAG